MLQDIAARRELLFLIGQPVQVRATIVRLGHIPDRPDRADCATALLQDIELEGVQAPITHAWVRFGQTGSSRAREYGAKLNGCALQMDAVVSAYRGGQDREIRLGLGDLSNVIAFVQGKWRTIARSQEPVDTDRGERLTQCYVDSMIQELLYAQQKAVMHQLQQHAQSQRVDKAALASLTRFFARKETVTPGQLRHAQRILERA